MRRACSARTSWVPASTSISTPIVGAGAYICGEETALLDSLEGKTGKPRFKPPFPAAFGLYGMPTTINNTQSYASVPTILRKGAQWFADLGPKNSGGTVIFSVSGHVEKPGNFEVPLGIPFADLLELAGGVLERPQAQGGDSRRLLGAGGAGRDHDEDQHGLRLAKAAGSAIGSAAVIVMDETTCMVRALERLSRFYMSESCGQCTPCREGTGWMNRTLKRMLAGQRDREDLGLLLDVANRIEGHTICGLGDAAAWPVQSFLKHYRHEFEYMIDHGGRSIVDARARGGMSDELVNIEVNGVPMKARKGETIIRATDREGVYVPRFCYHDKLPIAANCRMCLVEVEKAPKPLPACATPVAEGMKIFTHSAKAIGAQRAVMEFLLINHPLDCPICDQGGECELQDLALGFGRDISRFVERKRVVKDKNLGPLVSTDMTRCIHCTRCVRFGQDIAGIQEMGATGRGEHMEIGTYIEHSVDHELSGNIIDLCPVGALNSKPFRYRGRGWEMTQFPLISPHDGVGTQLYGHVLRGRLMRVVPRPLRGHQRDLDRRSRPFQLRRHLQRRSAAAAAGARGDGSWREVEWDEALEQAAGLLRPRPAARLGLLAHPSSTLEELYLLSRLADGLGSAHLDHRLRQRDFRDQAADAAATGAGTCRSRPSTSRWPAHHRLEPAPGAADPGAPRAQGRAARRATSVSSTRRCSSICSR